MGLDTGESIRQVIASDFRGRKVIAVSNHEPHTHVPFEQGLQRNQAVSGLVSAVEPIMLASGGVWIALGRGDAVRESVDKLDQTGIPLTEPAYTLRRVSLTPTLARHYCCGLAKEAILPACPLAFGGVQFTEQWWQSYQQVNEAFGEVVLEEAGGEEAVVLVLDYHFALLPEFLKRRNPALRIALFWHIPWLSSESVRILPWKAELLQGLLGADVLGFRLSDYSADFLGAVSQYTNTSVDTGSATAVSHGHTTTVRSIPIGVDFASHLTSAASKEVELMMGHWRDEFGSVPERLGIGIDRIEYTMGIPERLKALDLFFERHPEFIGRLVFLQVVVLSRVDLPECQALQHEITDLVSEINAKWRVRDWRPVVLIQRRGDEQDFIALHLLAEFCVANSPNDGNLVATEFVSSRIDEDGVLILGEFGGAPEELSDALIVNPFHIEQIEEAIHTAVTMAPLERRTRMAKLRATVAANDLNRWGIELLTTLAKVEHRAAPKLQE